MQTLIWHFDLFPKSKILIFSPKPICQGCREAADQDLAHQSTGKIRKLCQTMQCKHLPPPSPSFILLFGFILRPNSVKLLGCTKPRPQKSMGGFSHQKKEKKPPSRRKYRKCSHGLPLGWRDVQSRWSVYGTWKSSLGARGTVSPISHVLAWNNSDEVTAQQLFGMSSYRKLCRIPDEPGAEPFELRLFCICAILTQPLSPSPSQNWWFWALSPEPRAETKGTELPWSDYFCRWAFQANKESKASGAHAKRVFLSLVL